MRPQSYESLGAVRHASHHVPFFKGATLSPNRTGEEGQISIGICDDEGYGAPGFLLEGLMEGYVQSLIAQKSCLISSASARVND